jgi:hypothetical protein
MKILRIVPAVALLMIVSLGVADAQCKAFAKKVCLPELENYVHDGNYHAAILKEGEEAELYKTFYSDMDYRVAICGEESIPGIEFTVLDANKNVLFSNKDKDLAPTWDFHLQSSQQLKIVIKVNSVSRSGEIPAQGCVAIMFGFKTSK